MFQYIIILYTNILLYTDKQNQTLRPITDTVALYRVAALVLARIPSSRVVALCVGKLFAARVADEEVDCGVGCTTLCSIAAGAADC